MYRPIAISTSQEPEAQENIYLFIEAQEQAFFFYQQGTLATGDKAVIQDLFALSGTKAKEGFLISAPKDHAMAPLWEVEKITRDGRSTPQKMTEEQLVRKYGLPYP